MPFMVVTAEMTGNKWRDGEMQQMPAAGIEPQILVLCGMRLK